MATKIDQTFRIDGTPAAIMDIMRNAAFVEESEKARDALTVSVTTKEETDQRHIFEIHTTTYARGVGGIDRSKTENNRTVVTWNKTEHDARWDWSGAHGRLAKVTGTHHLTDKGGGSTELRMTMDVEISIPVVGKMIEKKVKAGFEEQWPLYVERIRAWLKK
jgi:hypothetical protein